MARLDGGRTFKEAVYAIEQNMSQGMRVGVSGEDDVVPLNRGRNVQAKLGDKPLCY